MKNPTLLGNLIGSVTLWILITGPLSLMASDDIVWPRRPASVVTLGPGSLLNLNFGLGDKSGFAAIGKSVGDVWNVMGQAYNPDYTARYLRRSDGAATRVAARLENSGGIWGNKSGDTMYDSYVYPNSGPGDGVGDMTLTLTGLPAGHYDLALYGHADHITPDNRPENDSAFRVSLGGNNYGPIGTLASPLWTVELGWQEGRQYVVFHDLEVSAENQPLVVTIQPGYNGDSGTQGPWDRVASLNGLQLLRVAPGPDADHDGVSDDVDQCPNTPPEAVVDANGCSLEQLCPCDGAWRNHGQYVRNVVETSGSFHRNGLITAAQRIDIIRAALRSNCGRRQ